MNELTLALELTAYGIATVFAVLFLFFAVIWFLNKAYPNKEDDE